MERFNKTKASSRFDTQNFLFWLLSQYLHSTISWQPGSDWHTEEFSFKRFVPFQRVKRVQMLLMNILITIFTTTLRFQRIAVVNTFVNTILTKSYNFCHSLLNSLKNEIVEGTRTRPLENSYFSSTLRTWPNAQPFYRDNTINKALNPNSFDISLT